LRASVLSFASPKESSQRKGDPGLRGWLRQLPCATRNRRGLRNSGCALRQSSPFFRRFLRCSALHTGPEKRRAPKPRPRSGMLRSTAKKAKNPSPSWPRAPLGPLRGAEQRRNAGGLRFAMFEPQASSGKPPGVSSSARNRRSRHRPRGRLFFAYFLLAKQKKVRRPQAEHPRQTRRNPKPIVPSASPPTHRYNPAFHFCFKDLHVE
jgi:hypothetical protein